MCFHKNNSSIVQSSQHPLTCQTPFCCVLLVYFDTLIGSSDSLQTMKVISLLHKVNNVVTFYQCLIHCACQSIEGMCLFNRKTITTTHCMIKIRLLRQQSFTMAAEVEHAQQGREGSTRFWVVEECSISASHEAHNESLICIIRWRLDLDILEPNLGMVHQMKQALEIA